MDVVDEHITIYKQTKDKIKEQLVERDIHK